MSVDPERANEVTKFTGLMDQRAPAFLAAITRRQMFLLIVSLVVEAKRTLLCEAVVYGISGKLLSRFFGSHECC